MNETELNLLRQIDLQIKTLSDDAKKLIETLDTRLATLYDHKKITLLISTIILELKKHPKNPELIKQAEQTIEKLRKFVLPAFSQLHPEISNVIPQEISQIEPSELHDIEELEKVTKDLTKAKEAESKLQSIMSILKRDLQRHKNIKDLTKHYKQALENINEFYQAEKNLLFKQEELIKNTEKIIRTENSTTEYDSISYQWREISDEFQRLLRAQKIQIRDHLRPFFTQARETKLAERLFHPFAWIKKAERPTKEEVQKILTGVKITREDIIRDLATFTSPGETTIYLKELREHLDLLDNKARQLLLQDPETLYQFASDEQKRKEILGFTTGTEAKKIVKHGQHLAGRITTERIYEYKTQSEIDELTGLQTRRAFDKLVIEQINRGRTGFTLLFIDIDRFKLFNDTYNHFIGDMVLNFVARTILKSIRTTEGDLACRWGGEEIVVMLKGDLNRENAIARAEQIRANVQAASFEELSRIHKAIAQNKPGSPKFNQMLEIDNIIAENIEPLANARNQQEAKNAIEFIHAKLPEIFSKPPPNEKKLRYEITISIGTATFPEEGKTIDDLKAIADVRLKEAKGSGRNKVVSETKTYHKVTTNS